MSYALKYKATFKSTAEEAYSIELHKKDYAGSVTAVLAAVTPAIHRYDEDDPRAAIKGCSAEIKLVNKGDLPLSTFYSVDDDTWKVFIKRNDTQVLFAGFLVQQDCSEPLDPTTHEITLSANDNLGLLKSIKINENFKVIHGFYNVFGFGFEIQFTVTAPALKVGNFINIFDTNTNTDKGTYKILNVSGLIVTIETTALFTPGDFLVTTFGDIEGRMSLLQLVGAAIQATGLELSTNIFASLKEVDQSATSTFLAQTFVDVETFLKGAEFKSSYDVLQDILSRFKLTLFQALGEWFIVRWDEYRLYKSTTWTAFKYTKDFAANGTTTYANGYAINIAESYIIHSIERPYKFAKESFSYDYPKSILQNSDLQQIGSLITSYSTSPNTTFEYKMPKWFDSTLAVQAADYRIRVVRDSLGNELERYAVVKTDAIKSTAIEVNQGDRAKFTFQVRATTNPPTPANLVFVVELKNGTLTRYAGNKQDWKSTTGYTVSISGGANLNEWQSVTLDLGRFPFDGLLYCYLTLVNGETHYNDMRFEYTTMINESTKIIGHTHTSKQAVTIKNESDEEIVIDDSPRNAISGTLFNSTFTGLLQNKTKAWHYTGDGVRLGDMTTFEELFWKREQRSKLEGNIIGLVKNSVHLSLLSSPTHPTFSTENFVFGSMEIDYRNDSVNGVLWELFKDGEANVDLTRQYIFQYLYDTK